MRRILVALTLLASFLMVPAAQAAAPPASNVHIFYYSWYGNPAVSGSRRHWPQGGHTPPQDIGANYYPTLGAYDSGDAATVNQHMAWIAQAGVGVVVFSWWGQNSFEDQRAQVTLNAAAAHGLKVAWHLEPYGGRTAASTVGHRFTYRDATDPSGSAALGVDETPMHTHDITQGLGIGRHPPRSLCAVVSGTPSHNARARSRRSVSA